MTVKTKFPILSRMAAVDKTDGSIKLIERLLEYPTGNQILIKVLAVGICMIDYIVKQGIAPLDQAMGHEIVGDIVAVGPEADGWKEGDRVGVTWFGSYCLTHRCFANASSDTEVEYEPRLEVEHGYPEHVLVCPESLVSLPKDLDPAEAAPLLCAGIDKHHILETSGIKPREVIAVQGNNGFSHLAAQFADRMGLKVILLVSELASTVGRKMAQDLGVHAYVEGTSVDHAKAIESLGGAKVVILTKPRMDHLIQLESVVKNNGTILLLPLPAYPLETPTGKLARKGINVTGSPLMNTSKRDHEKTIAFYLSNDIQCHVKKYCLEDAALAYRAIFNGQNDFMPVIVPFGEDPDFLDSDVSNAVASTSTLR